MDGWSDGREVRELKKLWRSFDKARARAQRKAFQFGQTGRGQRHRKCGGRVGIKEHGQHHRGHGSVSPGIPLGKRDSDHTG